MNILLIRPSIRENCPPSDFPVGLGIIAAIMRQQGHQVRVYDQNALRVPVEDMLCELGKIGEFDVIGLGGLITIYSRLKMIVPALRERFPRAKIVVGGGVTIEPDVIFEHMPVDFCVHGEGEWTFAELCRAIEKGERDFSEISGISYVHKGELVRNKPREIERNLDLFPMPAYDLFPTEIYLENARETFSSYGVKTKRCATLLTSRGCPNQCTYCWRMSGRTIRFRSLDLLIEEIGFLRSRYKVDSYFFLDECINASRKRTIEFAVKLINNGFAAPWASSARVNKFDGELATLLSRAGCKHIIFGVESGSQKILKEMNKNASPGQASQAVINAWEAGIYPTCNFMIGMPGETKETVGESVQWIRKNRKRIWNFGFFFVTPYPGCDLYREPLVQRLIQEKFATRDNYFSALGDASRLTLNMTGFSDDELANLREWAKQEAWAPKWLPGWVPGYVLHGLLFLGRLGRLICEPYRWRTVVRNRLKMLLK
jgi:anaerobic magnesium-protoporphyrin IX monomethyl ester cyclase